MLNRLQAALFEHDFVVQYKKGTTMPADYLSRLPSFPQEAQHKIAAFDFNMICLNSKIRIQIYRPSFNSLKLVIGFLIYQNAK
jgi:hypothetical protein